MFVYDPAIHLWHDDQRVSLEQMCRRFQRDARHGDVPGRSPPRGARSDALLLENAPVTELHPWRWRVKRYSSTYMRARPGSFSRRVIAFWERRAPESPVLRRLYSMTIGAYIFRGVREGLRAVPGFEARHIAIDAVRARVWND